MPTGVKPDKTRKLILADHLRRLRDGTCVPKELMPGFIGIDPGMKGGISVIWPGRVVSCFKMPVTEQDTIHLFYDLANCRTCDKIAVIEKVHSMPGQGVASSFKFGMGYGGVRMAAIASEVRLLEVSPRKWQKELGVTPRGRTESKTQFKNRLKAMAQQLFPSVDITLAVCDSLLIAEYARRTCT